MSVPRVRASAGELDLTHRERLMLDAIPGAVVAVDGAGLVNGWNTAAEELFAIPRAAILGRRLPDAIPYELHDGTEADIRAVLDRGETWSGTVSAPGMAGALVECRFTAAPLPGQGERGYIIALHVASDPPPPAPANLAAEERFAQFVATGPSFVLVKDHAGGYLFANEHALLLMGPRAQPDYLGRTDRDLWPAQVAARIRAADAVALRSLASTEVEFKVRGPGGMHTILMSTFPLRGAGGELLLGGIGLDITARVRRAEPIVGSEGDVPAERHATDRAAVADALVSLRHVSGVDATASAVCRAIHALPRLSLASIILFELDETATPIGVASASGPARSLPRLPKVHTRLLRARAAAGPWTEPWTPPSRHSHGHVLRRLGIQHVAYAPIHVGGEVVGVLMIGAAAQIGADELVGLLPAITEFAALAGALLTPVMSESQGFRTVRNTILGIIRQRAFHPVFQPIVDLKSGLVVGYEALTRFDDGVDPGTRFGQADAVALGLELEMATLKAALHAARGLPPGVWLSVNVSPGLVMSGSRLRSLLRRRGGENVCEVTEHEAIVDYPAFRAMVALIPGVRISIDDVGAGFASFRHILELRPAFVKLDRSLIAGIDGDPVRRELITGIGVFVQAVGARLIAEGIETDAERIALRSLDVALGQGFLLGRPTAARERG